MDPLSIAASVAGIATFGAQLSQAMFNLVTVFCEAEREITSLANDLSLLAMVLEELETVIRLESKTCHQRLLRTVNKIVVSCQTEFSIISTFVTLKLERSSSIHVRRRIRWFFQRQRVKPLKAALESLKSTLNVLLQTIQLAKAGREAEAPSDDVSESASSQLNPRKEARNLVNLVLDNRHKILDLNDAEGEAHSFWSEDDAIIEPETSGARSDESRKLEKSDGEGILLLVDEHIAEYSTPDDSQVVRGTQLQTSDEENVASQSNSGSLSSTDNPTLNADGAGFPGRARIAQASKRGCERYTTNIWTTQWFLSVVPHERDVTRLNLQAAHLGYNTSVDRAQETAKLLLLTWTHADPNLLDGNNDVMERPRLDSDRLYGNQSQHPSLASITNHRQRHIRPPTFERYQNRSMPDIPHISNEDQETKRGTRVSDNEKVSEDDESQGDEIFEKQDEKSARLTRLLKLSSDQRADREASQAETGRLLAENEERESEIEALLQETLEERKRSKGEEKGESIRFKDAIGRRFQFPFDLVKEWRGMEYLIKEAFLHVDIYGPHVADGEYDLLAGPKDEIIMKHVWETMIRPGLDISMAMWPIPELPDPVIGAKSDAESKNARNDKDDLGSTDLEPDIESRTEDDEDENDDEQKPSLHKRLFGHRARSLRTIFSEDRNLKLSPRLRMRI